jgi:glucokinase
MKVGLTAVNLGWSDFPFRAELARIASGTDVADLPMFLVSHRDSTVLAERSLGAARDCDEGLLIFGQRGIGMGIFAGGRTVVGWRKMAGEIGHLTIDPSSDQICRCGKRGCVETVASAPSMVRRYLERVGDPASGRSVHIGGIFDRARAGEPAALEVVRDAGRAIGLAVSHAISILNPKTIILSGDFAVGEEILLPFVREEIERNTIPVLLQGVSVVCSSLGLDVRLKGAGAFAFSSAIADPALLNRICRSVLGSPLKAHVSRA